jgi:neutral ceramidase
VSVSPLFLVKSLLHIEVMGESRVNYRHCRLLAALFLLLGQAATLAQVGPPAVPKSPARQFRAGAFAADISPLEFPVIVNGGMTERTADKITDRLHARCLVLDDGTNQVALAVIDNCMVPRHLLDEAKEMASRATGIPTSRMLLSATHTHTAPSVHPCLGSDADAAYSRFLPAQIAKGIAAAHERLQPARIGWAFGRDEKNVACRHWLVKPGVAPTNPFGGTKDDVVMMHPGHNNPSAIMATGRPDPEIPVISLQTPDGQPLAIYSAYSLHYVGQTQPVSADYFALYCDLMTEHVGADKNPAFMAALANATSGDMWLMDYTEPERRNYTMQGVAEEVSAAAFEAYRQIEYFDWVPLVMEESLLEVGVRIPSAEEIAQAQEFMKSFEGRKPKTVPEVYARETVLLSQMPPTRELKLQALRIGDLAIGAIPNETYASTGLWLKKQSPVRKTFVVELANGCEGYIPPPELHPLGGYTCWRARTACLEPEAERKIRSGVLALLKMVDAQRRDESPVRSVATSAP